MDHFISYHNFHIRIGCNFFFKKPQHLAFMFLFAQIGMDHKHYLLKTNDPVTLVSLLKLVKLMKMFSNAIFSNAMFSNATLPNQMFSNAMASKAPKVQCFQL